MYRLITIEWRKLKNSTAFYIFSFAYVFLLGLLAWFSGSFGFKNEQINISLGDFGIFDFPVIWQVITYISSFLKIILAVIFITFVTNEYQYRTLRQNLIDGLSKKEFLISKIAMMLILSFISTFMVFAIILILGLTKSSYLEFDLIMMKSYFILAYFLKIVAFFSMFMFLAFLTKKTGFTLVSVIIWVVIEASLKYKFLPEGFADFLPLEAMSNLIHEPFTKITNASQFLKNTTFDTVNIRDVIVVIFYVVLFNFGSYQLVKKRDL